MVCGRPAPAQHHQVHITRGEVEPGATAPHQVHLGTSLHTTSMGPHLHPDTSSHTTPTHLHPSTRPVLEEEGGQSCHHCCSRRVLPRGGAQVGRQVSHLGGWSGDTLSQVTGPPPGAGPPLLEGSGGGGRVAMEGAPPPPASLPSPPPLPAPPPPAPPSCNLPGTSVFVSAACFHLNKWR